MSRRYYNEDDRRRTEDFRREPRYRSQSRVNYGRGDDELNRSLRNRSFDRDDRDYDRWGSEINYGRSYNRGYEPGYGMSYQPSSRIRYPERDAEQFGRLNEEWSDRDRFEGRRRERSDSGRGYIQNYGSSPSDYDRDYYNTGYSRYGGQIGERGWWERVSDEVASWFGDEEAERRRRMDEARMGSHRGKGPRGYKRSEERIREDVNERLTDYDALDASDIEVVVNSGNVILNGTVDSRWAKRVAEDIVETVSGVTDVQNNLRVGRIESETLNTEAEPSAQAATKSRAHRA